MEGVFDVRQALGAPALHRSSVRDILDRSNGAPSPSGARPSDTRRWDRRWTGPGPLREARSRAAVRRNSVSSVLLTAQIVEMKGEFPPASAPGELLQLRHLCHRRAPT